MTRRSLDDVFPTLVRYTGYVLTLVLTGFSLAGYYVQAASGLPIAGGMILYKTVHDAAQPVKKKDDEEEETEDDEKWSHLP